MNLGLGRRSLIAVVNVAVIGAWLGGAAVPPAHAGASVSFTDPAGDATGLDPLPGSQEPVLESTPRPSDPELDLVAVAWTADAKNVTVLAKVGQLGAPPVGIGTVFRFWFSYSNQPFQLIAQLPSGPATSTTTTGLFMRARMPTSAELNCRDCRVSYDAKSSSIKVTASIAGLSAGMRQQSAALKALKPGATLTGLAVLGQRLGLAADRTVDVGRTVTADVARAAPGASLTL
ncbi:MAG TPA: hypothetical protein VM030_08970 [Acidimicrobiales bacterium]|nr:hypothetical protein [Acidimicrobiales bacterium]